MGEWEVIKQGDPRFEGHYQPKQPFWGYEPDNDPEVVERWIDAAVSHGVNTFIYDWYWFMNGPYLESALNDGFLKAKNRDRMNFYIMWANHTVAKNYWNCRRYGDDDSILFSPVVDWADFRKIVDRIISQYFVQPNYLKFDNCPVMAIFDYDQLVKSFGSVEETAKALDYFRDEAVFYHSRRPVFHSGVRGSIAGPSRRYGRNVLPRIVKRTISGRIPGSRPDSIAGSHSDFRQCPFHGPHSAAYPFGMVG